MLVKLWGILGIRISQGSPICGPILENFSVNWPNTLMKLNYASSVSIPKYCTTYEK